MPHETILVVEDDQFLADAYDAEFKKHNYTVLFARDGVEALEMLEKKHPDLVILDLIMLRKNGVEVLQELSKKGIVKKVPVVVASNLDKPGIEEECTALGARGFFIKSNITMSDILEKCRVLMQQGSKQKKSIGKKI
jgi:CheY-like chemotaxis protein